MDSDDKSVNGKRPEEEISVETIEDQAARGKIHGVVHIMYIFIYVSNHVV